MCRRNRQRLEISVFSRSKWRRIFRIVLSDFLNRHGHSHFDYGTFRRASFSQNSGFRLQATGTRRQQMALAWLFLFFGLSAFNDVLHDCFRLDAQLFLQIFVGRFRNDFDWRRGKYLHLYARQPNTNAFGNDRFSCVRFSHQQFQKGLELVSKVMMVGLFILILALAVHSLCLPNAIEGVKFYLLPNLDNIRAQGLGSVITAAMNQAFFTLSLGVGAMEIFGSYTSDKYTLGGEAVRIGILDTMVAIAAGLIIIPACFAYNVEPDAGPSLIFLTLPHVFLHMEFGRFWGAAFFLFMTFASLSTVLAVFENLLSGCLDEFHWTRKKATLVCLVVVFVLSIPCALGYNLLSDVHPIGEKDILDSEDFIVSNFLLPLGSLVYLLFCVSKWGWGFDNYLAEANKGKGLKIPRWFKNYFRFVLPILILIIFVNGLL